MIRLAIRCHSCAPLVASELEDELERQLEDLRAAASTARVRLTRLTQKLPASEIDAGWLLELEVPEEALLNTGGSIAAALADAYRDMRFLGLEPTVLAPIRLADWSATPGSERVRTGRASC